jgi:hypothetical protein
MPTSSSPAVPEPSTVILLALAFVSMISGTRWRRRHVSASVSAPATNSRRSQRRCGFIVPAEPAAGSVRIVRGSTPATPSVSRREMLCRPIAHNFEKPSGSLPDRATNPSHRIAQLHFGATEDRLRRA